MIEYHILRCKPTANDHFLFCFLQKLKRNHTVRCWLSDLKRHTTQRIHRGNRKLTDWFLLSMHQSKPHWHWHWLSNWSPLNMSACVLCCRIWCNLPPGCVTKEWPTLQTVKGLNKETPTNTQYLTSAFSARVWRQKCFYLTSDLATAAVILQPVSLKS